MRRVNGYKKIRDLRALFGIGDSKVSNLKMADYDKEIPFGDGVENRGVDDDDEIEMRNLNPFDSYLRGVVQKTQLIAPPIQKLTEKHLLLKE